MGLCMNRRSREGLAEMNLISDMQVYWLYCEQQVQLSYYRELHVSIMGPSACI